MKYLFSLLSLALMSTMLTAQNTQKAKEILDQVSAKTKTYTTISADFSFSLENQQEKINEVHQGSIKVKGNKYAVKLMGVETFFDGKNQWTYMKDAGEVQVIVPDAADESVLNPAKIFTMYEKGFKFSYIGEKTEGGKVLYEIDLFPENRDKPFSRIKLLIQKDNLQLYSFKQIGKDGNHYTVKVSKMQTNQSFADTDFTFNKLANPNVDVIDLR
ncbi:outer membrane lipoprotein-sorting protein [Breznakibacter xylanolyticus]|uniref:Outer membrane lipoprotein-sorting protein n=1 Tax=Breznakibacter xylanolyticus TaxID=990 RepID=A0A2W7N6C5_9BACT|nr:outer membrane lipoprotein carrier protein LolA [Breznakibacter xylanolyticus]PZX13847.1 outer membrane lipoprotein-sorting protein [Breznakibacter xylanolyticus]